jgi:iron complex transport system substrate-binding protein
VTPQFPQRIVCLSAESSDILFRLGIGRRIVGVSAFAKLPSRYSKIQKVSGFSSANLSKIVGLRPDLIITYSDVQAKLAQQLIEKGCTVLATNQQSLSEIWNNILLLGRLVGKEKAAQQLAERFKHSMKRQKASKKIPKVYFEEWNQPLISGIGWVSELIKIAGGKDVFSELIGTKKAMERSVSPQEVVRRNPDIIIASWCGKKVDLESIRSRPGWNKISAVKNGRVYSLDSSVILQPGPILMDGLKEMRRLIKITAIP